jgi:DNA polymerase-3 subunit chi
MVPEPGVPETGMARADFYIMGPGEDPRRFACSLANKAFKQGHRLHILATDRDQALTLDELLWTFHDISFLPHALLGEEDEGVPVTIGWPGHAQAGGDVLINLTPEPPQQAGAFERVAEVVADDDDQRRRARERYRHYREQGFELHSHDLARGTTT